MNEIEKGKAISMSKEEDFPRKLLVVGSSISSI